MSQLSGTISSDDVIGTRVRLAGRETVWKGFIHLERLFLDQTMPDGRVMRLVREVHDHGNAAAILLYDAGHDSVVLVRQFRSGAYVNGDPAYMLEVPAGLLDEDDPSSAIRRESMEETGYRVENVRFLFDIYPSPGALAEKVSLFFAVVDSSVRTGEGGGVAGEGEDIEVLQLPLGQAFGMIASGDITDAKTIILLQWAMMNRGSLPGV